MSGQPQSTLVHHSGNESYHPPIPPRNDTNTVGDTFGPYVAVEEDVDSDILVSDDEGGSGEAGVHQFSEGGEEDEEDEEESDEEYEEYQRFISTIFQDDLADMSGTDGDEDEDYSPDDLDTRAGRLLRLGLDLEDEETDDEYFNVTRKEVHDLVDASLQVLAKTKTSSLIGEGSDEAGGQGCPPLPSRQSILDPAPNHLSGVVNGVIGANSSSVNSNQSCRMIGSAGGRSGPTSSSPAEHFEHFEQLENMQKRNRLISAVVSKMFAGENEDNLVVDDMPIHNIRKLVARQMSMSVQLMIQMLLLSENMSESDRQCSEHLMELSNLRSTALTKTYLITEQMESLKAYQSFTNSTVSRSDRKTSSNLANTSSCSTSLVNGSRQQQPHINKKGNVGQNSRFLFDVDEEEDEEDDDYVCDRTSGQSHVATGAVSESNAKRAHRQQHARTNQHMTRNRAATDPLLTRTSSSVFNIPTLSRVHVLLQTIDAARRERDRVFQEYVSIRQQQQEEQKCVAVSDQSLAHSHVMAAGAGGSGSGNRFLSSITSEERTAMFHIMAKRLEQQIAPAFCVRLWKCLLPSRDYPLSPDFVNTVNPASLYGSTIFSPAEDDLLLRGIISVNNSEDKDIKGPGQWEKKVKEKFLPSKEVQLLQYRQIQLSSGQEDSKFKRYRIFEMEKQRHQKWTSEEDKELLRGFQVFGSKWFMVKLYFLPNKSRHEIKLRWTYLLKDWEKNFQKSSLKTIVKNDGKFAKPMKQFLKALLGGAAASGKKQKQKPKSSKKESVSQDMLAMKSNDPAPDGIHQHQYQHQQLMSSVQPNMPPFLLPTHPVGSGDHASFSAALGHGGTLPPQRKITRDDDDNLVDTELMSDSDSDADSKSGENDGALSGRDVSNSALSSQPLLQQQHNRKPLYAPQHSYPRNLPGSGLLYPRDTKLAPASYPHLSHQTLLLPQSQASTSLLPRPRPANEPALALAAPLPAEMLGPLFMQQQQQHAQPHLHLYDPLQCPSQQSQQQPLSEQPPSLERLLAEKDIPSLLGKRRKKDSRVKSAVKVSSETTTAAVAGIGSGQNMMNGRIAIDEGVRSAHTSAGTGHADACGGNRPKTSDGESFRLFDSVMSGANSAE